MEWHKQAATVHTLRISIIAVNSPMKSTEHIPNQIHQSL